MTTITPVPGHDVPPVGMIENDVRDSFLLADRRDEINGFITRDDAHALAHAMELDSVPEYALGSPVRGWTCAVKDNIHVEGLPNSAGTPSLASFTPRHDDGVVRLLRDAGVVILGKANMHELAFGSTSNNRGFGAVRNPLNLARNTGGSSGGTAALVAAGVARLGLGTDTGGSVRVPASFTGVCGHRPTTGTFPGDAVTPLSRSRDTIGTITRTVADLTSVFEVITGITTRPEINLAELRLGLPTAFFLAPLARDVETIWQKSLELLRSAGVTFVEIDLSEIVALDAEFAMPLVFAETLQELPVYLERFKTGIDFQSLVAQIASPDVAKGFGALGYRDNNERDAVREEAFAGRERARALYASVMESAQVDAIAFPTTPITAPLLGVEDDFVDVDGVSLPNFPTAIRNTSPGSFAGIPGVTVPMPVLAGMPAGFGLDGRVDDDARVLAVAALIEAVFEASR